MAQTELHLESHSPEETQRLGLMIGELAQAGDIILLSGPLGAGKTCLAQGIARGLDISESAASPSYVLMRELAGRLPFYHMDLYRLGFKEIDELGLDDYLYGRGICAIEWAEKGLPLMPAEYLLVNLSYAGEEKRRISIVARGARYQEMAQEIARSFDSIKKDNT